ncbi:MAG TPA: hypothetical protein VKH40_16345 [Alloacidobacterium sp.]|nr:hypothetical protein [Alloacidobacterium sp.]
MYNECRHIFTSGKKCQSPALKDQSFCYFHSNTRKRPTPAHQSYEPYVEPKDTVLNLPPLEEADAIQLALSDVVLALAANRIDARRARILIYGLQVASQNHHRRVPHLRGAEGAANVGLQDAATMVREIHEHEDGTLIGPAQQSPDPEEIEEQRRPPSLGEILLREAEAMKAQAEAEREAQRKAEAEEAAKSAEHTATFLLPRIHAVADTTPETSGHRSTKGQRNEAGATDPRQGDTRTTSRFFIARPIRRDMLQPHVHSRAITPANSSGDGGHERSLQCRSVRQA